MFRFLKRGIVFERTVKSKSNVLKVKWTEVINQIWVII